MENIVETLIEKLMFIAAARRRGDISAARPMFDTIRSATFPSYRNFPMSHGVFSDPEGALFFIDHDWDYHGGGDWFNRFSGDVIRALQQFGVDND